MNDHPNSLIMTKNQLQTELMRCEYCEEKPCKEACPVNCSPFDFIMAAASATNRTSSDLRRRSFMQIHWAAFAEWCARIHFAWRRAARKNFDGSINIPKVQATLVEMAKTEWRHSQIFNAGIEWKESGGDRRRSGRTREPRPLWRRWDTRLIFTRAATNWAE